ncbi:hypothetical protein E2C06_10625 [Dankookia rubra]|uniref:Uncharacterized protein n=1 Tax=Dankookia rubra TaxID=1442381 RepID=A0A4R5QJ06_9PROT|nr:hypothetical protein E2C06_10625 [Dankookia rubra]
MRGRHGTALRTLPAADALAIAASPRAPRRPGRVRPRRRSRSGRRPANAEAGTCQLAGDLRKAFMNACPAGTRPAAAPAAARR